MPIRLARPADLATLQQLEVAAGEVFREVGMSEIADAAPPTIAEFSEFQVRSLAWVREEESVEEESVEEGSVERRGLSIAAFVLVDELDGAAHIEQVSVHPDWAGRRIGALLIDHVAQWAVERELPALTLTTYEAVPWNGPYYERLGFRWLSPREITPGLRAIRAREAASGLDRWPRGAMRRELTVPA